MKKSLSVLILSFVGFIGCKPKQKSLADTQSLPPNILNKVFKPVVSCPKENISFSVTNISPVFGYPSEVVGVRGVAGSYGSDSFFAGVSVNVEKDVVSGVKTIRLSFAPEGVGRRSGVCEAGPSFIGLLRSIKTGDFDSMFQNECADDSSYPTFPEFVVHGTAEKADLKVPCRGRCAGVDLSNDCSVNLKNLGVPYELTITEPEQEVKLVAECSGDDSYVPRIFARSSVLDSDSKSKVERHLKFEVNKYWNGEEGLSYRNGNKEKLKQGTRYTFGLPNKRTIVLDHIVNEASLAPEGQTTLQNLLNTMQNTIASVYNATTPNTIRVKDGEGETAYSHCVFSRDGLAILDKYSR